MENKTQSMTRLRHICAMGCEAVWLNVHGTRGKKKRGQKLVSTPLDLGDCAPFPVAPHTARPRWREPGDTQQTLQVGRLGSRAQTRWGWRLHARPGLGGSLPAVGLAAPHTTARPPPTARPRRGTTTSCNADPLACTKVASTTSVSQTYGAQKIRPDVAKTAANVGAARRLASKPPSKTTPAFDGGLFDGRGGLYVHNAARQRLPFPS